MTTQKNATGGQPVAGTSGHYAIENNHSVAHGSTAGKLENAPIDENSPIPDILRAGLVDSTNPGAPPLGKVWKLRTLADAYKERPPLEYVIDGILPVASLSIVYGAPGSLKSFVLADAALCVAAGLAWLEPLPVDGNTATELRTTQYPALWIDFDNGSRRTDERFDALGKARNLPADTPLYYVSLPDPWLDANNKANVTELAFLAVSLGVKLIVIDNLGLITGDVEENSAQMAGVMGNLRKLAEATGAAVVVIHHQRKSNGGGDKIRKGETLRGHSSIEAALDLALVVERKPGTDDIAIVPTKERGATLPILGARFTYQHRAGTKELAGARFWAVNISTKSEQELTEIQAQILVELERHKAEGTKPKQSELVNTVRDEMSLFSTGPSATKVRGALSRMVDDGRVIVEDGNVKNAKLYSLGG